jgi:hypothetical protein
VNGAHYCGGNEGRPLATKKLHINLDVLANIGQRGVRRATAFVAMGQKAWTDESIRSATVDTVFPIRLLPDPMPQELADEVRRNFRLWVIGNAITEIVQGLSLFADDCYETAMLVRYHGKPVPQDALTKVRRCRSDTNLHSKLGRIEEDSGIRLPLLDYSDGWTRARNTLAHNNGIVRERDFSPDSQVLTVKWRHFQLSIDGEKIDNIIGHTVEKGGMLGFQFAPASKDFKLGDQISFSEQEILDVAFTAHVQIASSVGEMKKYIDSFITSTDSPV